MNAVTVDVDMLDDLPAKTMLRMVEQAQAAKQAIASFQKTIKAFSALFRSVETMDIEPRFDLSAGSIDLSFTGTGDKLRAVWVELRRAGYKPNARPEKGKTQFYTYWEQEGYARIWMNFSSSVCRRVQVGTKTVETPVYETQCDEIPMLEAEDQAALPALEAL